MCVYCMNYVLSNIITTEAFPTAGKYKLFSKEAVSQLKEEFQELLMKLMSRKKSNSAYFLDQERYSDFIKDVKEIKQKYQKDFYDYKMLANYDILEVNGKERLIKPKDETCSNIKFYIPMNELFSVLHTMHLLLGHPDKERMDLELKTKYCNISKEVIKLYMSICKLCRDKE